MLSLPRSCLGNSSRTRVFVDLRIELLSPVLPSLPASPAGRAELCKLAERISLEGWLQTASPLHSTTSTSLLLSPHPQGWEGQGSARAPFRDPEGSCRVLKATAWGCKAAGATGPRPEDRSWLFGAVTWNSCLGTDPCAELSTFSSPQRKKMVLSP